MSEIADNLIDALLEREATEGATMIWPSASADPDDVYPCSVGEYRSHQLLDVGGFKPFADAVIVVRVSLFGDINSTPKSKETIGIITTPGGQARRLRIDEKTVVQDQILVLSCNQPSQGV